MSVETIYRLTPLQEGLLFHSLGDRRLGLYVEQGACRVDGALDPQLLARAWQQVVARHAALRASFHWREVDRPVQVIHGEVEIPWRIEDWRGRPDAANAAGEAKPESAAAPASDPALEALFAAERAAGFDLERAPLMRLALARIGEASWRVVWTYHHLLLDGWSLFRVLGEVFTAYGALAAGAAAELPPARPYEDYVAWLERRDPAPSEAFWRRHLAGFREPSALPLDRIDRDTGGAEGRPAGSLAGGAATARAARTLSPERTARVIALGREAGVTVATIVHAAWAALLARTTGEDDVVFGTVVAGRPPDLPGAETMVGLLINTVPLRVPVPERPPVRDWLPEVGARLVEILAHGHTPLARAVRGSEAPADRPLFETLIAVESYPRDPGLWDRAAPGLGIGELTNRESPTFPINLAVVPGEELFLRLAYDPGRLAPGDAERILGWLETLLAGMAADPGRAVGDLPLLSAAERREVSELWADGGPLPAPVPSGLHVPVLAQAALRPEAVALDPGGGDLNGPPRTYSELAAGARAIAGRLAGLGVGPETLVGLFLEPMAPDARGYTGAYEAILGILAAGGAYLPLDPELPDRRLAAILADARPPVVVTRRGLRGRLGPAPGTTVVDVDELLSAPPSGAPPPVRPLPEQTAYVIYTSGSTGRPKGVVVPHRAAAVFVEVMRRDLAAGPETRALQAASLAFDASVFELFVALAAGGRVCPVSRAAVRSGTGLADALEECGVTMALTVPQVLEALPERPYTTLRTALSGGDRCPAAVAARWSAGRRFVNTYGPTEGTVAGVCHAGVGAGPADPPLGRPIAGSRAHLADARLRPVPAGVTGELLLAGACLARGYLGRPATTAERFVPDPFSGRRGERLYRSGDLGRWRADGVLEFLGRADQQVKVRGHRIELGEIEVTLRTHPEVAECAVAARGEAPHRHLVAYVVRRDAGDGGRENGRPTGDLAAYLGDRLPSAMVPRAFGWVPALPRTATGKLDRRALARLPHPSEAAAASEGALPPRPPAPGTETVLKEIADIVLDRDVGVDDDFFELGVDSVQAIRFISRAADRGIEITPRQVFDHPSVAELAALVDS